MDEAWTWPTYLHDSHIQMSQKDGVLSLWMGQRNADAEATGVEATTGKRRWEATALGCSRAAHKTKGYFSAECVMKTDSWGAPVLSNKKAGGTKSGASFEAGRYASANSSRTALLITYVEMVRLLEGHDIQSFNAGSIRHSSLIINTAVVGGARDLVPWARVQAEKIKACLTLSSLQSEHVVSYLPPPF